MMARKYIIGGLILGVAVLAFWYYKHSYSKSVVIAHSENTFGIDYNKVDPKVMREAMQKYKQPTVPPVTTIVSYDLDEQTLVEVKRNFKQPSVTEKFAFAKPEQNLQPTQVVAQANKDSGHSYIPPIDEKVVQPQQTP